VIAVFQTIVQRTSNVVQDHVLNPTWQLSPVIWQHADLMNVASKMSAEILELFQDVQRELKTSQISTRALVLLALPAVFKIAAILFALVEWFAVPTRNLSVR
jgi:hypothetical protein